MDIFKEISPKLTVEQASELADRYGAGVDIEQNELLAFGLAAYAAEQGNPLAQTILAYMFENGIGVADDPARARIWYLKAAEQGDSLAQNNLAYMLHQREGGPADPVNARTLYLKAAEQGHAEAQNSFGFMLYVGDGGAVDLESARQWFEKSAEQGHAAAQYNLACMLADGEGGEIDLEGARQWFEKAADQGHAEAQQAYAQKCIEAGGQENIDEAFKYATLASRQGVDCRIQLVQLILTSKVSDFQPKAADLGNWATLKAAGMECRELLARKDGARTATAQP